MGGGPGKRRSKKRKTYNERRNLRRINQRAAVAEAKQEKAAQRYVNAAKRALRKELEEKHLEEVTALKVAHQAALRREKELTDKTVKHWKDRAAYWQSQTDY